MINEIGDKLKFLRKSKGYTQKELGKLLNIGQTTIANYENGYCNCQVKIPLNFN